MTKVAFYVGHPNEVSFVRAIVPYLNEGSWLVFTDRKNVAEELRKYKLKYRYIKDYRIMVWEMALYKPHVFVDFNINIVFSPRIGNINVLIPRSFMLPLSDNLHFYDFILVSNKFNKIRLEQFGIDAEKVLVFGFPKFDLAARNEEVMMNEIEEKAFEKYKDKPHNSGLRIAAFLIKQGRSAKINEYPHLKFAKRINRRKKNYDKMGEEQVDTGNENQENGEEGGETSSAN